MNTLDQERMPIICAGTDMQPACKHYRAGGCWHPRNLRLDLVIGKMRPRLSVDTRRLDTAESHIRAPCGSAAQDFEPRPTVDASGFLEGSGARK